MGSNQYALRGSSNTAARVAAGLTPSDVDRLQLEAVANAFSDVTAPADHEHLLRLAAELLPDPRAFKYHDERIDFGDDKTEQCACGARIRYAFPIVRDEDGKTVNIGSTCIVKSVPFLTNSGADVLAADLLAAYDRHVAAIAEAERNARNAKNETVVEVLTSDFDAAEAWVATKREELGITWLHVQSDKVPSLARPQVASTPGRTAASMRKRHTTWFVKQAERGNCPPIPSDLKSQDNIRAEVATLVDRSTRTMNRYTAASEAAGRGLSPIEQRLVDRIQEKLDKVTRVQNYLNRFMPADEPADPT